MQQNPINKSVTFMEIISTMGMTPQTSIMAPKKLLDKIARGEKITDEEAKQFVKMDWNDNG